MPTVLHPLAVRAEVLAARSPSDRLAAQQLEVVGDVAGAAAELAAHARHQERHVQDVHLVRQDVVLELVREHHDGVVGERSADQCALVFPRHANELRVRTGRKDTRISCCAGPASGAGSSGCSAQFTLLVNPLTCKGFLVLYSFGGGGSGSREPGNRFSSAGRPVEAPPLVAVVQVPEGQRRPVA